MTGWPVDASSRNVTSSRVKFGEGNPASGRRETALIWATHLVAAQSSPAAGPEVAVPIRNAPASMVCGT